MVIFGQKEEDRVKWGTIITEDDDFKMYQSFTYRGIKFSKYDTIYTFSDGAKETDIGKIMRILETKKEKRVKILWFFRPNDICHFLDDYRPSWKELFLASGNGKGLTNDIPLEAIIGKCNVICTSKDRRNAPPTKSEVAQADYFFSHVFDVDTRKLSEKLPDTIGSAKVDSFLNKVKDKPKANVEGLRRAVPGSQTEDDKVNVKEETFRRFEHENQPLKKRKILEGDSTYFLKPESKTVGDEEADMGDDISPGKSQRQATEQNWLLELPWEKKIVVAHERRRLVTMINLDPSYTSSDVQEMILFAFKLTVDAKIIPRRSSSSPLHGQALVVFNSTDEADFVISELKRRCLVDEEGRPIVAFRTNLIEPPKTNYFPGHLVLERYEIKKRTSKADAVSTSHCAQHNTIECQMATEWIVLHEKFDRYCKAVHEMQAKETADYMKKLKNRQPSVNVTASEKTCKQEPEEKEHKSSQSNRLTHTELPTCKQEPEVREHKSDQSSEQRASKFQSSYHISSGVSDNV